MPNAAPAIRYQLGKLVGYVVSTKMNKSVRLSPSTASAGRTATLTCYLRSPLWQITVNIPWLYKHPKYERVVTRRTKVMAHDEYELCSEGDMVRASIQPARRSHAAPGVSYTVCAGAGRQAWAHRHTCHWVRRSN